MADAAAPNLTSLLAPNQVSALSDQITSAFKSGANSSDVVAQLLQTPTIGPHIEDALANGTSEDDIVNQFGGQQLAQWQANDPATQVSKQSFLTNLGQGAAEGANKVGMAAGQLVSRLPQGITDGEPGSDASNGITPPDTSGVLPDLQKQEAAYQADPKIQALNNTAGGKIGSTAVQALPYIAAGAVAPEGMIPAIAAQGLAGAASGALTPTTGPGQIVPNMATDAALGAATQGTLGLVGKGAGALGSALGGMVKPNVEAATEQAAAGLTPTLGSTNSTARALGNALGGGQDAVMQASKANVMKAALAQVGVTGESELSPDLLTSIRKSAWAPTNQALADTTIAPNDALSQKVADVLQQYNADALDTAKDGRVEGFGTDILSKAAGGQLTGARAVDYLRDMKDYQYGADNQADRTAFQGLGNALQGAIGDANPDALQLLNQSNQLDQKWRVLKEADSKANGQLPTPQQFVKANQKFANPQDGSTPFQQLSQAVQNGMVAPSGTSSRYAPFLASALSKAVPAIGAYAGEHVGGPVGAMVGAGLGHGGDVALGKVLSSIANKPITAPSTQAAIASNPRLKALISQLSKGGVQAGVQQGVNPQQQ